MGSGNRGLWVDIRGMVPRDRDVERTGSVIGAFYEVYNTLGFGFLETAYSAAFEWELRARGHQVAREVGVRVVYKGFPIATHRLDLVVDETLVVEIKSTPELPKRAGRQVFNYLKATGLRVGFLFHFGPEPKFFRINYHPSSPNRGSI